jgi:hypothetical protein
MLNLDKGTVHLSYEQGAGSTTLLLTIVREYLEAGNRVIWLGRDLPDGERSNHILGSLNGGQLQKFSIIKLEDDVDPLLRILKIIIKKMGKNDLLLIDDWCPKTGRASKIHLQNIKTILALNNNIKSIITSTSYENIDATNVKLKFRGGKKIFEITNLVHLYKNHENNSRILKENDNIKIIKLTKNGFE